MVRSSASCLLIAAALLVAVPQPAAACTPGNQACPIPITFAPGAYSGQRTSHLTGVNDVKWFVVKAKANQSMIVWVVGAGPTRGVVYFPNGQQSGQPGGRVYDGQVPVSGAYRIRVTESLMANQWKGPVTVVVLLI